MKLKTFKNSCEGIILIEELPDQSELKQMVSENIVSFGLCPNGGVIALDNAGKVLCTQVEVIENKHICENDFSPCNLKAELTEIQEIYMLMRNFPVENFLKQEGVLPNKIVSSKRKKNKPEKSKKTVRISAEAYDDEDEGISPFLAEDVASKKRTEIKETVNKIQDTNNHEI